MKRIFSMILATALMCSMLTVGASAANTTARTVSAGGDVTAFVDADGNLWTWGANWMNALGDNASYDDAPKTRGTPQKILSSVVAVSINDWGARQSRPTDPCGHGGGRRHVY